MATAGSALVVAVVVVVARCTDGGGGRGGGTSVDELARDGFSLRRRSFDVSASLTSFIAFSAFNALLWLSASSRLSVRLFRSFDARDEAETGSSGVGEGSG